MGESEPAPKHVEEGGGQDGRGLGESQQAAAVAAQKVQQAAAQRGWEKGPGGCKVGLRVVSSMNCTRRWAATLSQAVAVAMFKVHVVQ
jgi:hypothetical protein